MKRSIGLLAIALTVLLLGFTTPAPAQSSPAKGTVIIPESSIPHPGQIHTNLLIFVPDVVEPSSYPSGENPGSLACIYKLVTQTKGCQQGNSNFPTGGANAIAVTEVDANPDAASDIKAFATAFGLPTPNLQIVCVPSGYTCHNNSGSGWDVETSLDIEYSFGMAPKATIYLVEDSSDDPNTPLTAVSEGATLVAAAGGGEVSSSWGGGEFNGENQYDSYFQLNTVVFFASSGDGGAGVIWPSASPDVVSAGGTTIERNSSGNFTGEEGWYGCGGGGGGGPSQYEKRPKYQNIIKKIVSSHRGTPDLSFDANPCSGVAVYNETSCEGWCVVGGTSVSSPSLAGVINAAGQFNSSTTKENTEMYSEFETEYKVEFRDITKGNTGWACKKGWDYCTGIGSDLTYAGK